MRTLVIVALIGCGSTPAATLIVRPVPARRAAAPIARRARAHDPAYGTIRLTGAQTLTADADAIASKLADNDTSLIGIATVMRDDDALEVSIGFRIPGEPSAGVTYTELTDTQIELTADPLHHYRATTGTLVLTFVERTGSTFADKLWTIHGTFTATLDPTETWDHHAVSFEATF